MNVKLEKRAVWIDQIRRFCRYAVVGGTGVFVDMAVLYALADGKMLGWPLLVSKVVAAEVAMVNNFVWNDLWTFAPSSHSEEAVPLSMGFSMLKRFAKFNLVCAGGVAISGLILTVCVKKFGIGLFSSNALAIGGGMVWNFALNSIFTWRSVACRTTND